MKKKPSEIIANQIILLQEEVSQAIRGKLIFTSHSYIQDKEKEISKYRQALDLLQTNNL